MEEFKDKKVLIVDDDPAIAVMISDFCGSIGFSTKVLTGSREVVRVAKDWQPNLITLDLMMPEFSGFEVIEALKGDEGCKKIPVVIISVLAMSHADDEVIKLSQGLMSKPFKMGTLLQKIETVLAH